MEHILYTASGWEELEQKLIEEIKREKAKDPLQPVWVLVGSRLLARYLERRVYGELAQDKKAINIHFIIFPDLVERLYYTEPFPQYRPSVDSLAIYLVAEKIIKNLDRGYFWNVKQTKGLLADVLAVRRDLKDGLIMNETYEHLKEKIDEIDSSGKVREVFKIIDEIDAELNGFEQDWQRFLIAIECAGKFKQVFNSGVLFVYGFYDYTAIQKELIKSLSQHCQLKIFMIFPENPFFNAFAKWAKDFYTSELKAQNLKLKSRFGKSNLKIFLTNLSQSNPKKRVLKDDLTLRIVFAPSIEREAEEICREIFRLIHQGVKFEEIGVLVRDFNNYRRVLESAFNRYKIPYYLEGGKPVLELPCFQAIIRLLKIIEDDYSRKTIVKFLKSRACKKPNLSEEEKALTTLFDLISQEARIVKGRKSEWEKALNDYTETLQKELKKWQEKETEQEQIKEELIKRKIDATNLLSRVVSELITDLEALQAKNNLKEQAEYLKELVQKWIDFDFLPQNLAEEFNQDQQKAKENHLQTIFDNFIETIASLDSFVIDADFEIFSRLIEMGIQSLTIKFGEYSQGGVCLSELMNARGARFRAVIIPGLYEGSFPLKINESPLLLDDEREQINQLLKGKTKLALKRDLPKEERLLFYLACQQAEEYLVITSCWLSLIDGRPQVISYLLADAIERTQAGKPINYEDTKKSVEGFEWIRWVGLDDFAYPFSELALDKDDFEAGNLNENNILKLGGHLLKNQDLKRALNVFYDRWIDNSFGIYSGNLSVVDKYSADRFSIIGQKVSHSKLKNYLECPFRYFLSEVLEVSVVEEPEFVWTPSGLEEGNLLHQVLQKLFESLKGKKLNAEEYRKALLNLLTEKGAEILADAIPNYKYLPEEELRELRFYLENYYEHIIPRLSDWETEIPFRQNFILDTGESVILSGRIDRMDKELVRRQVAEALVVDYKASPLNDYEKKPLNLMQLVIYLISVVNKEGISPDKISAQFIGLKKDELLEPVKISLLGEDLDIFTQQLQKALLRMKQGIEKGIFIPKPDNSYNGYCEYCKYSNLCLANTNEYARKEKNSFIEDLEQDLKDIQNILKPLVQK